MNAKPRLLFVSPQFLFPLDAGGKIRTVNILRHMKGGAFEIELVMPATEAQLAHYATEIAAVCDYCKAWRPAGSGVGRKIHRFAGLVTGYPIAVWSDRTRAGRRAVADAIKRGPDVVVFDFTHAAVLRPPKLQFRSVLFTHNVETEIFRRHAAIAKWPIRFLWRSEHAKMARYERHAVQRFDTVIAVSERDSQRFQNDFGVHDVRVIPTGVDLTYFAHQLPPRDGAPVVAFTGSMDWRANVDGIQWFMNEVWPLVARKCPRAGFRAVGRNPPESMIAEAQKRGFAWEFTGFVDDIRDHVRDALVYVIPLRVGGGTRIKAYEAMAMGTPVVSTGLGVEGLPLEHDVHYLRADDPENFADTIVKLLRNQELRERVSMSARTLVENSFGAEKVASVFENICLDTGGLNGRAPEDSSLSPHGYTAVSVTKAVRVSRRLPGSGLG